MAEWWRRAQWVLNATASTNDTVYSYGIRILGVLAKSDLAGSDEASLFEAVWEESCTKMRDKEIRHLLEQHRDASQAQPTIPRCPQRMGSSEDEPHGYLRGDEPTRKDQVFATLRREILASRRKVTLDEQLNRETSRR